MDKIKEVKEALDKPVTCEDGSSHYIDENNKRYLSSLICQLFDLPELSEYNCSDDCILKGARCPIGVKCPPLLVRDSRIENCPYYKPKPIAGIVVMKGNEHSEENVTWAKSGESRLLTPELVTEIIEQCANKGFPTREAVWQSIKAQDTKTTSINNAKWKKAGDELLNTSYWRGLFSTPEIKAFWEILKKQEGING